MTQQELDKIVEQHQHWLNEDCEGWEDMRAKLRGVNLSGADLSRADQFRLGKVLDEKDAEIRRLRRALFIAHAIKAKFKWWWMSECKHNESCKLFPDPRKIKKFTNSAWACSKSQAKCRAKAEEYK